MIIYFILLVTEATAILYFKNDAVQYLKDRPAVKAVYPLTPDAKAIVFNNTPLPLEDPLRVFTDYSHRRVVASVRAQERSLHPIINNLDGVSSAGKQALISLLHCSLSSCYYIRYMLRGMGPWLIYNGTDWVTLDCLDSATNFLLQRIIRKRSGLFKVKQDTYVIGKTLVKLMHFLIALKIKNKKCVFLTGLDYGLNHLSRKIQLADEDVWIVCITRSDNKSLLRLLKSLAFLYLPFFGKRLIKICPVQTKVEDRLSIFFSSKQYRSIPFSTVITNFLNNNVSYSESISDAMGAIVRDIKPVCIIAHHLRWLDAISLGQCASHLGVSTYLISHGSQALPENITSGYELKDACQGLCVSPFATKAIAQSPIAEKTINALMPTLPAERYKPIMWGYKMIALDKKTKTRSFRILYCGTYKVLAFRPWIYETSNEFVDGLQHLVGVINDIDNVELVIRIRDNDECELSSLKSLLPKSNNCRIKTGGSFHDDLAQADLLVSFASTTIEETLNARKPVALFGGSDRYRHLPGSSRPPTRDHRSAVYHLTADNMTEMLTAIRDLHSNKPLTEKEITDYVWPESVPGLDRFVSEVLATN